MVTEPRGAEKSRTTSQLFSGLSCSSCAPKTVHRLTRTNSAAYSASTNRPRLRICLPTAQPTIWVWSRRSASPRPGVAPEMRSSSGDQHEVGDQRRAAVRHERQGYAGQRHQPHDAAHDDERLHADEGGEAHGEQALEPVARAQGDAQAGADDQHEGDEHGGGAQQAQLLDDGGEDEVVSTSGIWWGCRGRARRR